MYTESLPGAALPEDGVVFAGAAEHDAAALRPPHFGVRRHRRVVVERVHHALFESECLLMNLIARGASR